MKAIMDCNNFYCSCERLFKPWLTTTPLVVLSNNDGCIISRSAEAKELGIKMAAPYFMVRPYLKEKGIVAFSSNYALYGDLSKRVMDTVSSLLPWERIEVYSIDEAFLDLGHLRAEELEPVSVSIRQRVGDWTGIPVSIGVAPTKTLAKMANRIVKSRKRPKGVLVLDTAEKIDAVLLHTPVKEIWGVGARFAAKLQSHGMDTAFKLKEAPPEWVRANLGGVVGLRLLSELNSTPAIDMDEQLAVKKMVSCTRRFGVPLRDLQPIREAVATYTSRAAEKLRRQDSAAAAVTVFLIEKELQKGTIYTPLQPVSTAMQLPVATAATNQLIKHALLLLDSIFVAGKVYEKAGVIINKLVPQSALQGSLFDEQCTARQRLLMEKVDNVNFSMRNEKVKFASAGIEKPWRMRQEFLSKHYTTRWSDLRMVH